MIQPSTQGIHFISHTIPTMNITASCYQSWCWAMMINVKLCGMRALYKSKLSKYLWGFRLLEIYLWRTINSMLQHFGCITDFSKNVSWHNNQHWRIHLCGTYQKGWSREKMGTFHFLLHFWILWDKRSISHKKEKACLEVFFSWSLALFRVYPTCWQNVICLVMCCSIFLCCKK